MRVPEGIRYKTLACDFYRKMLRELAEQGISRDDGKMLDFTQFAERPEV
jgi:hypothetical protein